MSLRNPFENKDFLCRIEANDPDEDFILLYIPNAAAVSYELFDRVGRAVANNTNIRALSLEALDKSQGNVDLAGWVHFLVLIGRNRSITEFCYDSTSAEEALPVNAARILRPVFERNEALEHVSLTNLHCGEVEEVVNALAGRDTALKSFTISRAYIGDGGAEAIAKYLKLANGVGIHQLELSLNYYGLRGFQRIARALAGRDFPMEDLRIESETSNPSLADIAAAFSSNPVSIPNRLELSGFHICEAGGNALGNALVRRMAPLKSLGLNVLEHLEVDVAEYYHAGVVALLQILGNNPSKTPKTLILPRHFGRFFNDAVEHIEAMLRDQTCSLVILDICDSGLNAETRSDFHRRLTSICCNAATINSTYYSNHTLSYVKPYCPKLQYYLLMNRNPDKMRVARSKVCDTHLARNFRPQFFAGMEPSLLSEVLPFVNRAFADHEELTSGATTNRNDEAEQATNNCLTIHFFMIKKHPSLFGHLLSISNKTTHSCLEDSVSGL
ncbi:hypothetical protein ACHAXS_002398 [Conticribra weissflogii]